MKNTQIGSVLRAHTAYTRIRVEGYLVSSKVLTTMRVFNRLLKDTTRLGSKGRVGVVLELGCRDTHFTRILFGE